jgi:hypothetical protein
MRMAGGLWMPISRGPGHASRLSPHSCGAEVGPSRPTVVEGKSRCLPLNLEVSVSLMGQAVNPALFAPTAK